MKNKLLCVSFDKTVSEVRQEALRRAGYGVTSLTKIDEAIDLLAKEKLDLVVIGHRFPREQRLALAKAAKDCSTLVVLVIGASAESDIPADFRVYALDGTEGILKAVRSLFKSKAAA